MIFSEIQYFCMITYPQTFPMDRIKCFLKVYEIYILYKVACHSFTCSMMFLHLFNDVWTFALLLVFLFCSQPVLFLTVCKLHSGSFQVKSSQGCNPPIWIWLIFFAIGRHAKFWGNISNGDWFMAAEKFLDFTASASLNFSSGTRA